ncbi:hypothetical protein SAMN00768000_2515 [Sulfobacillus thermosulfidooxidans DSM 9293]|uniref:DUF6671 domain-containing protein n=1 Tax=Sulfobacillus thermosulfidooxidans (strain DSM 9293 / VKM B-1269 / AT-1) TaxID=929705 RepID=A0A1W1WHV3_SULTA|nr:DUF6671 family protein [Sulfobacillus thermosulfidooxidans]SMC05894.1 hypothetical protein SAMN00768000_2515 [Sulfobacillus thermosulfidooxidans DSM 9293]
MTPGSKRNHPYHGQKVALATKHEKEHVVGPPLQEIVGLEVCVPPHLDTDVLGTFSGEIPRNGTPAEVVIQKARMGMDALGLPLGLASEGSFGPHPQLLFVPGHHELLAFVDDRLGIEVTEQILSTETNYAHIEAHHVDDVTDFLQRAQFPSHGLIVRPNSGFSSGLLFKGIINLEDLKKAIEQCRSASEDGLAHVETDMRAFMNPSRQRVLHELAIKLAHRLASLCPHCRTPGWGKVDVVRGLPCAWCGEETLLVRGEIFGCALCDYRETHPRSDGLEVAPPDNCPWCNP